MTQAAPTHPVTLADIRAAHAALSGVVVRTPVLENADVNAMLGGRLLLKAENFQRTGAFKIRGAYYRISNMTAQERACGVVSYSLGNHAPELARAGALPLFLNGQVEIRNRTVATILTGGNIDAARFVTLIADADVPSGAS